jgi:hypothetical protein
MNFLKNKESIRIRYSKQFFYKGNTFALLVK